MPKQTSVQRWRGPAVLRVKSFLAAALCTAVALVFLPLWFGVPVAVAAAAWGLGLAVLGSSVTLDADAGLLRLRMGLLLRQVRLTDVTAVLVDEAKVSLRRARGGEISVYAWRKDRLDALLGVPAVAGDIGHAISSASALARAYAEPVPAGATAATGAGAAGTRAGEPPAAGGGPAAGDASGRARDGRTSARTRSRLATALLAGAGVLAIAAALLVRVHWPSPVLTVLGVLIAVALGLSGLLYLLVALWIALTGQAPRALPGRP